MVVSFAALNYQALNADMYFVLYLLLVFLLLFGIFVASHTSKPLKKIVKTAHELAEGNIHSRAYVRNNDEVGQLAGLLNKIGEKLEKANYEKATIHQAVSAKVNAIVGPLHETIEALEEKAKNRTIEFHKANEVAQKMQIDLLLKEAELVDLKGELAKLMKRKNKKVTREQA